jgi:hypothetical protein
MPLFLDVHEHVEGLTAEAVAEAHARDLEVHDRYVVNYMRYRAERASWRESGRRHPAVRWRRREKASPLSVAPCSPPRRHDRRSWRTTLTGRVSMARLPDA